MQMCYLYNFALNKSKNPNDELIRDTSEIL